jgi:transposase InsO family protein
MRAAQCVSAGANLQIALRPSQLRPDIDEWSRRLNANQFLSVEDARNKVGAWRVDYNLHRPHSSLRQLTPRKHLRRSEEEEDEASFFRLKKALKREPEHT